MLALIIAAALVGDPCEAVAGSAAVSCARNAIVTTATTTPAGACAFPAEVAHKVGLPTCLMSWCSDSMMWAPRKNGMCYTADKPK